MSSTKSVEARRILIVEDEAADIALWQMAFRDCGDAVAIDFARDGEAALGALQAERPQYDFALLDLNLPGRSGLEILQLLRADDRCRTLPVCLFSSSRDANDVRQGYRIGANCYIQKPDQYDDLVLVARRLIDFWFGIVRLPKPQRNV